MFQKGKMCDGKVKTEIQIENVVFSFNLHDA